MNPWVQSILASAVAVVPTVELARAFSLGVPIRRVTMLSGRSVAIIMNANVSDHWKAKILPIYALNMLRASLWILIVLILLAGVFVLGLCVGSWLFADKFEGLLVLKRTSCQLCSFVIAVVYLLCRRSVARVRVFQT